MLKVKKRNSPIQGVWMAIGTSILAMPLLESMIAHSGVFSRVSCLHLPCFVTDFVYMVFDLVFGFQAYIL